MKIHSLNTKIKIVFLLCFSLLFVAFFFFLKFDSDRVQEEVVKYHKSLSKHFFLNKFQKYEVINYLENQKFKLEKNHFEVLPNAKRVYITRGFETLKYKEQLYFHVTAPHFRALFKDLTPYKKDYIPYTLFALFAFILIIIYFWLIRSLKPLYELRDNIKRFSKGELSISCRSDKNDEIAEVSNEFDSAVKKIQLLLDSRQLFLRTVMHELKTPLAKGRIVCELIDDEKQKNRVTNIFERLDFLINDFAKVEQVLSNNYELKLQKYSIQQVFDASLEMLMLEKVDNKIYCEFKNQEFYRVDLVLMAMVFKNLIDNALKYSDPKSIKIEEKENSILFISKGKKLEKSLEEYFVAFHNSTKSKNHGMGLGLYIVKAILDKHALVLKYEYKLGFNIFKIIKK